MPVLGYSPFIFIFIFSMFLYFQCYPSPSPFLKQNFKCSKSLFNEDNPNLKKQKIEINCCNILQIFIFGFGLITLFWLFYLDLCNHVRYVRFNTNLSTCNRREQSLKSPICFLTYLSFIMLGLLLSV